MSKEPKSPEPNRVQRTSKIRPVNIADMRIAPVHVTQRPFRPAWGRKLAATLELANLGLPVINHRDGVFWVIDGQHRIYALKENGFGQDNVDCEVYENLTDVEAAGIFIGRNDSKTVPLFDKFHVACTAEYPRELAIRRAVETQGMKISRNKEEGCISAIGALGKVFDGAGGGKTGEVVLGQVVRTCRDAFASDPTGFDGSVIEGLGLIFNRYNGRTHEKDLASRLAQTQHGVRGLLRRAESQKERTGNQKAQCVAASIVEIYNKGSKHKLPSWWKSAS